MKKLLSSFILLFALLNAESLKNVTIAEDTKVDWMELQSGEWVRGEFKGMYSGKVEFDSEEFSVVKFNLDDVKQIITIGNSIINLNREMPGLNTLKNIASLQNNENEVSGNLQFKNNEFTIKLNDGSTKKILNTDIASIIAGEAKESNYWSASIFLGLDVLNGNSEQVSLTSKLNAERKTSLTRFRTDFLSTYTTIDSNVTTANNYRLTGSLDLYQTSHFYWRLASLEYMSDEFKNIDNKYTLSVGLGYDIVDSDTIGWSVTMGPGYQSTTYDNVEVNASSTVSTALVFLDTRYTQEITDDIDFIVAYNMYYVEDASGRYVHHAETSLQTELISDFTIDISLFWDRTELPVAFEDGTLPGQDDFKTMLAIGYSY